MTVAGNTDVKLLVKLYDSTSDLNEGITGLVFNSSGLQAYYYRPGAASATQITLATLGSLNAAHSDGGFLEVNATNMPGWYLFHTTDAMWTSGVDHVVLTFKAASGLNMVQSDIVFQITAFDLDSANPDVNAAQWAGISTQSTDVAIVTSPTNFADLAVEATTGYTSANVKEIDDDATPAQNLKRSAQGITRGAAIAGTLSTTQMSTDLTEATDDHYGNSTRQRLLLFTSGNLAGQATNITDYNGTTKVLTFDALTEAPAADDEFAIL